MGAAQPPGLAVELGHTGFLTYCAACHGVDGRVEVKVHGPRGMPVWGDWFKREAAESGARKATREEIVSERINALVAYIETIQEK